MSIPESSEFLELPELPELPELDPYDFEVKDLPPGYLEASILRGELTLEDALQVAALEPGVDREHLARLRPVRVHPAAGEPAAPAPLPVSPAARRLGRRNKEVNWSMERAYRRADLIRLFSGPDRPALSDPSGRPAPTPYALGCWFGLQPEGLNWIFDPVRGWYCYQLDEFFWRSVMDREEPRLLLLSYFPAIAAYLLTLADRETGDSSAVDLLDLGILLLDHPSRATQGLVLDGLIITRRGSMPDFANSADLSEYLKYLAVPSGRLRLSTLELEAHDREHRTLGLTLGDFLPDADLAVSRQLLCDHLEPNLFPEQVDELLAALGMAVSGRGQRYFPIIALLGPSGTGKGHVAELCLSAFRHRAARMPRVILNRPTSDILPSGADVLDRQPLLLMLDEARTLRVAESELLTFFGDNTIGPYRRPHCPGSVSGKLGGVLLVSAVSLPPMEANTGLRRRLWPIEFRRSPVSYAAREDVAFSPELLDALVTLVCQEASRVLQPGYAVRERSAAVIERALADVDPVAEALEFLEDDWDRRPITEVARELSTRTGFDDLNGISLGMKVRHSIKWQSGRGTNGVRQVRLRSEVLPEDER